ncbi:MAG: polysaccharide deacetylase family protein [Calditrichia bacterium]
MKALALRDILKYAYFEFFSLAGVYRRLRQQNRHSVVVLTYHGVVPEIPAGAFEFEYRNFVTTRQFRQQLQFLTKNYQIIHPDELANFQSGFKPGFLITFDDGFYNNLKYAAPLLQEFKVPACFFITTGLVGTSDMLWTEKVTFWLANTPEKEISLPELFPEKLPVKTRAQREEASQKIRMRLKALPLVRREQMMALLERQIGGIDKSRISHWNDRYRFLDWDEVAKFSEYGQVVGSHTHTHPILSSLDEAHSWQELEISKRLIEENSNKDCCYFAYPNGTKGDFNETHIEQLRKLEYKLAFTQEPGLVTPGSHPYKMERLNVTQKMSLPVFKALVSGFRLK